MLYGEWYERDVAESAQQQKSLRRWSPQSAVRAVFLVALFLIVFCVSILLVFKASNLFEGRGVHGEGLFSSSGEEVEGEDSLFPTAANIRTAGDFLLVPNAPELDPVADTDFVFFSWVKFRRLPKEGEEVTFISKLDIDGHHAEGYSLGFEKKGDIVHPKVYWRHQLKEHERVVGEDGSVVEGIGGSLLFAEISIVPKKWILIAFAAFNNKVISLSTASEALDGSFKQQFHGSHELAEQSVPHTESDLYLGSKKTGSFRGFLGPFGVFRGKEFQERWKSLLQDLTSSPHSVPEVVDADEVMLFVADSQNDLSQSQKEVRARGIGELTKKKKGKSS